MRLTAQQCLRAVAAAGIGLAMLPPVSTAADAQLAMLWKHCWHSSIFRHDSWEPGVVIICWPLFMAFWYDSTTVLCSVGVVGSVAWLPAPVDLCICSVTDRLHDCTIIWDTLRCAVQLLATEASQ